MSAGVFVRSSYNATYIPTAIHPIRVQPETITATIGTVANDAPTGAITNPITATVSRNKRQKGLLPRTVTLESPPGDPPAGYKDGGITVIPALQEAFWNAAVPGATCTYLTKAFTVVSRSPEIAQ